MAFALPADADGSQPAHRRSRMPSTITPSTLALAGVVQQRSTATESRILRQRLTRRDVERHHCSQWSHSTPTTGTLSSRGHQGES